MRNRDSTKLSPAKRELVIYVLLIIVVSPLLKASLGFQHPFSVMTELVGWLGLIVLGVRASFGYAKRRKGMADSTEERAA